LKKMGRKRSKNYSQDLFLDEGLGV
jgi:hypothetical protein